MTPAEMFKSMMETAKYGSRHVIESGGELNAVLFFIKDGEFAATEPDMENKELLSVVLKVMREMGIAYCLVSEGWKIDCKNEEEVAECGAPVDSPDRKEVVTVQGNFLGEDVFLMTVLDEERRMGEWVLQTNTQGRFSKEDFIKH
jgi:hypothetical protein